MFFFSGNNLLLEQWTVQRLKNHSFEIPLVFSISNRGLFTTSKHAASKLAKIWIFAIFAYSLDSRGPVEEVRPFPACSPRMN